MGEKAELTVMATYSDGSTVELDANVEWIITPLLYGIDINNKILTATRDGSIAIQAKVDTVLSNPLNLTIAWVVNGHTLPPEPDPVENDATLGGVDSNNNGVRDDVERNIYATYPVKLQRALLMDGATVFQEIMKKPADEAKETQKGISRHIHCDIYMMRLNKDLIEDDFLSTKELEYIVITTKERVRKYLDYNISLSGGNFASKNSDYNKEECSEEIQKILTEMGL